VTGKFDHQRLYGFGGMLCLISILVCLSENPRAIRWRTVVVGFLLQFFFGILVLRWVSEWSAAKKFYFISNK
jgi:CNT family concentrative nucleoside transporter